MSTPRASRPVALVTGASRGIGREVARLLADHHVLVGGRDAARVAAVVAELPSAEPFLADLTDPAVVAAATEGLDRLDVLVHSAGVVAYGPLEATTDAEWQRVLATNVVAPASLTRSLLPALRAAGGLVVFINSGAGLTAHAGFSVYTASKFALTALADSLRAEERGRVRVTSVHPGRVATDMQADLAGLEGRPYRPEAHLSPVRVAQAVRLAVDATDAALDSVRVNPA